MPYTFGTQPSDTVANSRGDVESGIVLSLFASEGAAIAGTGLLASVTTNAKGLWPYLDSTHSVVWAKTPDGSVYPVVSPEGLLEAGAAGAAAALSTATAAASATAAAASAASAAAAAVLAAVPAPVNVLTVGAVTTGAAGTPAGATITGTSPAQVLSLTIPLGATGAAGGMGPTGPAMADADLAVAVATGATKSALSGTYAPAFVVDVATYGNGTTDATAHIQAKINAAFPTAGKVVIPPGHYLISAPLTVTCTNTGTTNSPQPVPSIMGTTGAGRIGDEPGDPGATVLVASPTFPVGSFLIDYRQVGAVYAGSGAEVGGFTLDCKNRAAGFRAQGPREFYIHSMTIFEAAAPVAPGDGANGAFNITVARADGTASGAYNLIQQITIWLQNADGFWESGGFENTYLACRSFGTAGVGANYHLTAAYTCPSTTSTYIDCHYGAGAYGVQIDSACTGKFFGLSIYPGIGAPSKNALIMGGWEGTTPGRYPSVFTACNFLNNPGAGATEADGSVVRVRNDGGYPVDAVFSACTFDTLGGANLTDWLYVDSGIVAGSAITVRDGIFRGAPSIAKYNDQSSLLRLFNCKGITADNTLLMGQVGATAQLDPLTSTPQDVPGAAVTFTAPTAGKCLVSGTFDFGFGDVADMLEGLFNVDGANEVPVVLASGTLQRLSVSRSWVVPLAAGSHTLKLQAAQLSGAGLGRTNVTHTGFTWQFVPGSV